LTFENMQGFFALGSATASPTPTVKLVPPEPGQMRGCPLPGRWSIAAWEGADTEADAALDTCGVWQADVAYSLDPETGGWAGWFRDRAELSTLKALPSWGAAVVRGGGEDHDWIAFTSWRNGNQEIYVMRPNGTSQTRLTNSPFADFSPAWSPDGTNIAFTSDRDGNQEIFVMNANGTMQANLTNHSSADASPAWSPDGTKIAFTSDREGNEEIYVMNADGTGQARLTNNPGWDRSPAWSPDGSKIAFTSWRYGNPEIFVMNANGTGQTRLTDNLGFQDVDPSWSPAGSYIAFQSNWGGGNPDILVMNADGTGLTRLTASEASDESPAWSPWQ